MRSIARFIAGHPLIASTVGVVATVIVTGTVLTVSGPPRDPMDTLTTLGLMLVGGLGFALVGSQILIAQPGHRIGRLMLLMGASLVLSVSVQTTIDTVDPYGFRWGNITGPLRAVAEEAFGAFVLLSGVLIVAWFPDGRTTSRLGTMAQALTVVVIVGEFVRMLDPRVFGESALTFVLILGAYATALADLVVRYRRSDGLRRTQIRWVLASGAVTASLIVALLAFGDRFEWLWPLWLASTILPPVSIGIAITRYRLYEIDRIVSRTIGYGVVSAALVLVFAAVNLALQSAIGGITRNDPLVVAASTLSVAVLFNPARSRVQSVVDRRFNRARFDAERTTAGFASRLRDELDLATLTGELRWTSEAAVQPASSAVWLRAGGPR